MIDVRPFKVSLPVRMGVLHVDCLSFPSPLGDECDHFVYGDFRDDGHVTFSYVAGTAHMGRGVTPFITV